MRAPGLRAALMRRGVKARPASVDSQAMDDDFEWVGTPRASASPAQAPVRRRASRRRGLLRLALACTAVAAVAVVAIVLASGGATSRAPAPTPVSLAEQSTAATPGYRFTLTIEASAAGRTLETSAAGTIDQRHAGAGEMQVTVAGHSFRELFLGRYLYLEVPAASTPWVKVNLAAYERALGVTSIGGDDPAQTLTLLRAAAKVRLLGRATVGGVPTRRYHALVDLDRYAAVVAPALRAGTRQDAAEACPADGLDDRADRRLGGRAGRGATGGPGAAGGLHQVGQRARVDDGRLLWLRPPARRQRSRSRRGHQSDGPGHSAGQPLARPARLLLASRSPGAAAPSLALARLGCSGLALARLGCSRPRARPARLLPARARPARLLPAARCNFCCRPPVAHANVGAVPLTAFTPLVRDWFANAFAEPTPAQTQAWPAIATGENVLISAPTGSGKTLAAFLWGLDRFVAAAAQGAGEDHRTRLLYVSPLKALSYDVERNLRAPLRGHRLGDQVRVAIRTGDTPARERAAMLRQLRTS